MGEDGVQHRQEHEFPLAARLLSNSHREHFGELHRHPAASRAFISGFHEGVHFQRLGVTHGRVACLEELHDLRDERGVVESAALLLCEAGAAENGDLVRQRLRAQADERAGPAAAPSAGDDVGVGGLRAVLNFRCGISFCGFWFPSGAGRR